MKRTGCSRPIALALADGVITAESTVFDYGCGHGSDIEFLRAHNIEASGWDPYFKADEIHRYSDAVNLGYVLNVIEVTIEREETLRKAFSLARKLLIVSVRVEDGLEEADEFNDGVITKRQTFQKFYTQGEFREYIQSVLHRRTYVAALGILYVFNDEEAETQYVAARAFTRRLEYRADLLQNFKSSELARAYVTLANRLGRLPLSDEFAEYPRLVEDFGSPKRIERLSLSLVDPTAFQGSRDQRREDILTYLAMLKLENIKPPGISKLPVSIQKDIRAIWRKYGDAIKEGEEFLFRIGNPQVVADTCANSSVGKLLPSHLYVHRSAEDELPALLRVMIFAAKEIVGELPYDIVKIAKDGRAVSFLLYKDFDEDPHPALLRSVKTYLPKANFDIREYFDSDNPPILHRKETLVLKNYPHFELFARLTTTEEALGLLSSPDIGYRRAWENLLLSRGLRIESHMVIGKTD